MIDIIGVCTGFGETLCQFKIGSDNIYLSKIGKPFYILLNNRAILTAKTEKELLNQTVPVLSHIISTLTKKAQLDNFRWKRVDRNYTPLIDDVLKNISENLRPVEIFVLEMAPDEITENKPAELQASENKLDIKLEEYLKTLEKFGETIGNIQHTTGIILKTSLDKNIWGSKKVMSSLSDIKENMETIKEDFNIIEAHIEKTGDYVNRIDAALNKKIGKDPKILGKMIENFSYIKSFLSKLAQITQNLYGIDRVFKASVGYPATWFLDGSVFMPFLYEHENLIDHIVKAASLETDIIEPLLVWKIGEKDVR